MRIGILGGSFDPVHFGHLMLAECCREDCRLDQVWFVPTAVSPHKKDRQPASVTARIEMLQLATAGNDAFRVVTLETDRGGVSYTVQTLQTISQQHAGAELFLLMGADSLHDLPRWREPERICELALPIVVGRYGSSAANWDELAGLMSPERLHAAKSYQVHMPRVEISSSDIRRRITAGRSVRYWMPRAVEKYIQTHALYRQEQI
jgi:nicotinate-nucleotide adenylyltransferase